MSIRPPARSTGARRLTRTSGAGGALIVAVAIGASSCAGSPNSGSSPSTTITSVGATSVGATTTPLGDQVAAATSLPATTASSATTPNSTLLPRVGADQELIDAAWANDVQRTRELIAEGADVNYKDNTQQSAYLIATSEGYLELLDITFDNGADVTSLDSYNGTGLIRAAERGHAHVVGRLLQTTIDVNHINNLGWTALHESIILGTGDERYVDTVRLLVAGGADVTLPPRDGTAPIELARARNQDTIVATLQTALDAEPLDDANQLLLDAAASGDADAVAVALAGGAEIETRDANLRTPLLLAASNDHLSLVRLLVALGADVDHVNNPGWTALMEAVLLGDGSEPYQEIVRLLVEAGADITIADLNGVTAAQHAFSRGYDEIVGLLDAG